MIPKLTPVEGLIYSLPEATTGMEVQLASADDVATSIAMGGTSNDSVPDGVLTLQSLPDALNSYMEGVQYTSNKQINGQSSGTTSLGNISTSGYYTNPSGAQYKGYVTQILVNLVSSANVTFAIGLIDQYKKFIAETTFTLSLSAGLNAISTQHKISKDSYLAILTPVNGLLYKTDATSSYLYSTSVSDPLSEQTGRALAFQYVISEELEKPIASSSDLNTVKSGIDDIEIRLSKPKTLISPSGYVFKEVQTVNDSGIVTTSWVNAVPQRMLILGNSITRHPIASYWWGYWGMAASTREKDYVHVLASKLIVKNPAFTFEYVPNNNWELTHSTFNYAAQYDALVDSFNPDFILVRWGENVHDYASTDLLGDFGRLFDYFKTKNPNVTIMATGVFWANEAIDSAIRNAAALRKIPFIKMSHLGAVTENQSYMGAIVKGDDGLDHVVDNLGVALHPGDLGMHRIADLIYSYIV